MNDHKHKWESLCFHSRSGWMKETEWCPLCGTLRENDRNGRYHYRYPQLPRKRKHFNKKPKLLLQRYHE